jgi:hypothetical protein
MGEGILLFDGNTSILLKLVRPEQRENGVLVVSENDVATGIELDQNMVGILALAKRQVDDTIDAQLIDSTELFRPQMFPQLKTIDGAGKFEEGRVLTFMEKPDGMSF